jgi:hypothetical protein
MTESTRIDVATSRGGGGASVRRFTAIDIGVVPVNGQRPVIIS